MVDKKELAEAMANELRTILKTTNELAHKVKTLLQTIHREIYDDR